MKRSAALASLSRDHHHALMVAQRLRRCDSATAATARAAFLAYWTAHGRAHFHAEEDLLLPAYAAYGDAHHPLVLRALGDHREIRRRADRVAGDTAADPAALEALGRRLAEHVRLEERKLFPLIEQTMPADALTAVAVALEQAESPS
jgi:hypothetical protein